MLSPLTFHVKALSQRFHDRRLFLREMKEMKRAIKHCRETGDFEDVIKHLEEDVMPPKLNATSGDIRVKPTTNVPTDEKFLTRGRVDSAFGDGLSAINTTPTTSSSTILTTIAHAVDIVFVSFRSSPETKCLQGLHACIEEVVRTGTWSAAPPLRVGIDTLRRALEALNMAARWRAEDAKKGSELRECYECLQDAAKCGVEALSEGDEELEDRAGLTEVHLGVLEFMSKVVDTQL